MLLICGAMLPDFETGTTTQADVLIRDGRFAAIAPHLEADCPIVEASGLLMLPGMADLHTHMVQSLTQGPLDDLNITQWLTRMLWAQWSLTEDEWYYGVLLGCLRSIRYGVTAINEMTYYPHIDAVVQAYQDAGLRVTFGIGATDIAENDQIRVTPVDECLQQAEELYHKWHGRGLLRTAAVPQGRPACTPELMRALKQFARERGLLYHTHLAEGKAETERIRAWTGRGEAEELAHLGVLDESTILAHSIWLTQEEITLLAQSHAVVAHCPSTNMKLSDGAPPIAELLASGDVFLAMGNSDVPVGQYTQKIFAYYGLDEDALASSGVLTYGSNVKEVTTQVSEGTVDCGVIYATDAFSAGLTVVDEATAEMCGQVIYPAAVMKNSANPDAAKAFLDFLSTDEAMACFEAVGFSPIV